MLRLSELVVLSKVSDNGLSQGVPEEKGLCNQDSVTTSVTGVDYRCLR